MRNLSIKIRPQQESYFFVCYSLVIIYRGGDDAFHHSIHIHSHLKEP